MLIFLAQKRNNIYFCNANYNVPYTVPASLSAEKQEDRGRFVECCGEMLPAEAGILQRFMTDKDLSYEEQLAFWKSFLIQLKDPDWAHVCMKQICDVEAILTFKQSHFHDNVKSASSKTPPSRPTTPTAERHFVWLGDRFSISVDSLRNGISHLAEAGLIASDHEQQTAFRRCLGVALNEQERTSNQPWVRWIGPFDMLNYLIESLWQLQLIYFPGGNREKWKTLCLSVLQPDGTFFVTSNIKSNRCTNPEKIRILDHALLDSMRFLSKKDKR
jgi:hypothetical protein